MLKYALIGCGRIAHKHLQAALALEKEGRLRIAALCDLSPQAMEEKRGRYPLSHAACYTDYREMVEEVQPDLVAVATESGSHGEIALHCMEKKCCVMVEKPMALSLSQAKEMAQQAKRQGVLLTVCHQNRFNPAVQKLRQAVEQGLFGRIFYGSAAVRWHRDKKYYTQAPWRGTWERDGGALMNQCIHNIDLLQWMLGGEPVGAMAMTDQLAHPYIQGEDMGLGILKFQGGYGLLEGTTNIYPQNLEETLCIFGEKGTVKLGGAAVNEIQHWQFAQGESWEQARQHSQFPADIYGSGHQALYRDMVRAMGQGSTPYITGEEGIKALEIVLALYQSAAEGRMVHLPLLQGATADYTGRFEPACRDGWAL